MQSPRGTGLTEEMAAKAATFAAGDVQLDYSTASLDVVDSMLIASSADPVRFELIGAYLGEVLLRQISMAVWVPPPAAPLGGNGLADPAIQVGRWFAFPYEPVRNHSDPRWAGGLVEYATSVIKFGNDPTDPTGIDAGLHKSWRFPTNGERVRRWWRVRAWHRSQ